MKEFTTTDLYMAAYLKASQVPFLDTRIKKEGRKRQVIFVFDDSMDMVKDLKNQYFNRKAKVPALTYVDEIRAMKSLTHDVSSEE